MPRKGLEFLNKFLYRNESDLLKTLSPEDKEKFLTLLNYLQKNKYILDHDSQPLNEASSCQWGKKNREEFFTTERSAYYEVTHQCNLKCIFCYANPNYSRELLDGDTALSRHIIDQARELNITELVISGGEPLLRKDIFQILDYAKQKMKRVILITNGVLIDREIAEKLKAIDIDKISVSLESCRKEVHEELRGKGTFDKIMDAIHWLKEVGFSKKALTITTTITKKNYQVLDEMPKFAESLGVKMNFSTFQPIGRGEINDDLALSPQQYIEFIMRLNEYMRNLAMKTKNPEKLTTALCSECRALNPRLKNICGLVEKSLGIKANGDLVPCHLFFSVHDPAMIIGNIGEESIKEKLWQFYLDKIPNIDEREGCRDCNVRYFCGGECAAPAYFKHGSLYTPHPYCERFKIYYSALAEALGSQNEIDNLRMNIYKYLNSMLSENNKQYCLELKETTQ